MLTKVDWHVCFARENNTVCWVLLMLFVAPCRFAGDIKSPEGVKLTEEYHNKYMTALEVLWETNKTKYAKQGTADLQTVE